MLKDATKYLVEVSAQNMSVTCLKKENNGA
jgi:hypothetical protein